MHGGVKGIPTFTIFVLFWFLGRHQFDAYKRQLLQCGGVAPRERSPRARRFFHRRQPRDGGNYSNRNGGNAAGMRNDRGGDRRRQRRPLPSAAAGSSNANKGDTNNPEQNNENPENKQKSRRRYNRNRKPKPTADDQIKIHDEKATSMSGSLQMTASNLTTLLSELSMGANSLNTANSTSSESLDFEKINTEDTNLCSATSSRLAASFNKGN